MNTKDVLDRVFNFIQELTQFYGELSQELPDLRVVVDNTRDYSDVKKTIARLFRFYARKRGYTQNSPKSSNSAQTKTTAGRVPRRRF